MREEDFFPFEAANRKEFRFQKKLPKQYTLKTGGTNCVLNHFFPEEIKYKISKEYVDFLYILFFLGCYDAKEIAEKFGDKYLMSIKEDLIDNGNFWVLSSEIRKYLDKRRAEPFDFDDMDIIIPPSIYEYIRDHILQKIEGVEGLLESFQYNDPDVFGDLQHADLYGLKEDELLDIDVYPDSYSDPEYPFHYVADPGYRFDGFRWKYELDKLEDQKKELIYKRLYANTNRIAIFARYMFWRWEVNLQSFSNPGSPDDDASEFVKNHLSKIFDAFSKGICYLGPLREDPKPFYPYPGNSDSFDLGRKGEHTAGVLFLHGEKENNLPLPNRKEDEEEHTVKTIEAIKQWLSYIGVAEDIKTKLNSGIVLKIKTPGSSKWSDLTNVGVGVSQVIPIVVMCLTARKGNTLVFEQPELHLHPKMQTRLAEFFMAIANSGVQCIIETHSEYFINAMRLNIASDDLGKEKMLDNSIIYFVEKIQNSSIFREIKINDLGIIPHWPKDFFDEGIDQTDKIILASSKKRSQKFNDDEESDDE
jgi:predicted ATPase